MPDLPSFDKSQFRKVLGAFTTGVTIVTTRDPSGVAHGVTANSFTSVSLEPPLVLWSQALTSRSYPAFRDSEHFAVHILADDQVAVSNHFAKSQPDKFATIEHGIGLGGVPVLNGSAAHLECRKIATYPGGDHVLYLGQVEHVSHSGRRPLAYGSGRYVVPYAHELGPISLQVANAPLAPPKAVGLATEALPQICADVGDHTLCLAVWGNHGPTIIRWQPSERPVSEHLQTGLAMSVTRSSTGLTYAAFLPPEVTASFIDEDLRLFRNPGVEETVQREQFEAEIAEVRRRGLARMVDPEPSILHKVPINRFSAPIFDAGGNMVLALSLVAQADRLSPDWDGPAPQALLRAAGKLSVLLSTRT